jgi:hypothetical protein
MILPRQVRSGATPNELAAPRRRGAEPEITSSKISSDAVLRAAIAQPLQKSVRRGDHAHVAGDRLAR